MIQAHISLKITRISTKSEIHPPPPSLENAQHDEVVAVNPSRPCQASSFAVYGQDRDVPGTVSIVAAHDFYETALSCTAVHAVSELLACF